MSIKKKTNSKTTETLKKNGKKVFAETHKRNVVIRGNNGRKYIDINGVIALILALLMPYVTVFLLILALFGILDIRIEKKKRERVQKKEIKTIAKK